jgi:hypothetical protein
MSRKSESSKSLEQVLVRKAKGVEYEVVPSQVDGMGLRVEKGTTPPSILKRALGRLAVSGRTMRSADKRISPLLKKREDARREVLNLVTENSGLAGYESKKDGLSLTAFPNYKIYWDRGKLKESLGLAYSTVVNETLVVNVEVPLGHVTSKGAISSERITKAIRSGMQRLGFTDDELDHIVRSEVELDVAEERLGRMIINNQVVLQEGSGSVDETWAVKIVDKASEF